MIILTGRTNEVNNSNALNLHKNVWINFPLPITFYAIKRPKSSMSSKNAPKFVLLSVLEKKAISRNILIAFFIWSNFGETFLIPTFSPADSCNPFKIFLK